MLTDVLKNICMSYIADGTAKEEVIELLVDCGASYSDLKKLDFSKADIEDFIYYESLVDDVSEDVIWNRIR